MTTVSSPGGGPAQPARMPRGARTVGLGRGRRASVARLLPAVLGLDEPNEAVKLAADRLDDFVRALPDPRVRRQVRLLVTVADGLAMLISSKPVRGLDDDELAEFVEAVFDSADDWPDNVFALLRRVFGDRLPGMRDVARALLELCAIAWYGGPDAAADVGLVPLWAQPRVLDVAPAEAAAHPWVTPDRRRLDVDAIAARLEIGRDRGGHPGGAGDPYFAGDGRPRVAVIGSGASGAVVAARLAGRFDVAVFEAGPRLLPSEYPTDPLVAQAMLYERGLLFPSADLDLRVLQARTVGGGTAVNEGVNVRPRARTLDAWHRSGAGFDRARLSRAIDEVERRQRLTPYHRDVVTTPSTLFAEGCRRVPGVAVDPLVSDIATHAAQHADPDAPDVLGAACLGCGYCNLGCRFGHHLSVDRTFLADAERAGARVHANTPIDSLVPADGDGDRDAPMSVRGLRLSRDRAGAVVPVDGVVLCAGALGSAPLLHRSGRRHARWRRLPAWREDLVGAGLGFNYGTPVLARWPAPHARPGRDGVQVAFVATKPGDDSFIIENGWILPAHLAAILPAVGPGHRRLMRSLDAMALCVNTIGSPSDGRIDPQGDVRFRIGASQMGTIHATLATMVSIYLAAGAVEVRVSGLRGTDDEDATFDPSWRGREADIAARLAQAAPTAEHLALASGHPQGGLRMDVDRTRGVVGGDFRVHGTDNLWVADASVFPTTITINPQWLVSALAWTAADSVARVL